MGTRKKIMAAGAIIMLIAAFIGIKIYANGVAKERLDKAIADASLYADIGYDNVSVDLIGLHVRVSGVSIKVPSFGQNVSIDEVVLYDIGEQSAVPEYLSVAFKGIHLNIADLGEYATLLQSMGYKDELLLNIGIDYVYDPDEKILDIRDVSVGGDGLGEVSLHVKAGNTKFDTDDMLALGMGLSQLIIHDASLTYRDDSLVDRMIAATSQEIGTSPEEAKRQLIAEINRNADSGDDAYNREVFKAVASFIEDAKSITVSANPESVVTLGRISRMSEISEAIKVLKIKVKS